MVATRIFSPAISLMVRDQENDCLELSRLLAAAVVNPRFCRLLLEDPELALETGYQGETFSFSIEERDLIMSIRADTLSNLAAQLARTFVAQVPVEHSVPLVSSLG
jgi:hypothetical protein